jgi:hypothetical protein
MEEYKPSLVKAATQRPPSGKGRAPAATGVAAGAPRVRGGGSAVDGAVACTTERVLTPKATTSETVEPPEPESESRRGQSRGTTKRRSSSPTKEHVDAAGELGAVLEQEPVRCVWVDLHPRQ